MKRLTITFVFVCVTVFASNISKGDTPQYSLTDLGSGGAFGINNNGQIVGYAYGEFPSPPSAILYDATGQGNNITMGSGMAYSINDSGHAVGTSEPLITYPYTSKAVYYKPNLGGTYTTETMTNYVAYSINNDGQMIGYGTSGAVIFTYNENSHTYETTSLNGSRAYSNNDIGQISGYASSRAVVWNSNGTGGYTSTSLGTISGYTTRSEAKSINNSGQIVGDAYSSTGAIYRAVLFDETGGGQNVNLGTISGYSKSWAHSINASGQIVGDCFNDDLGNVGIATLFDPTGGGNNIDLNTTLVNPLPGYILGGAYGINDDGWIVGWMSNGGYLHAFLLTPVPEPATILLLGLGAMMLRKRR